MDKIIKRKNDSQSASEQDEKRKINEKAVVALWLADIAELCKRAFVSDERLYERAKIKLLIKAKPKMGLKELFNLHEQELTPAQEAYAMERVEFYKANRSLLAYRINRPCEVTPFGLHTSDGRGAHERQARLHAIGAVLRDIGWLAMPSEAEVFKWPHSGSKRQQSAYSKEDLDAKDAAASQIADSWVK